MVKVRIQKNPGNQSAVILVDDSVRGHITMTGQQTYTINTEGHIPTIDGLSDTSVDKVWEQAQMQTQYGDEILYYEKIETEDDEDSQPNDKG